MLEEPLTNNLYPQVNTPSDLPGLAKAAKAAGYDVVYKGKLHLTKAENEDHTVREVLGRAAAKRKCCEKKVFLPHVERTVIDYN